MQFDPYKVEVVTKTEVTTVQKIITAALAGYFFAGAAAIGIALTFSLKG